MTSTERRAACIKLLAEIYHFIAKCEDLADQRVARLSQPLAAKR